MSRDELAENVLHFLDTSIDSIEQLWVLLLFHSEPDRIWTVSEITKRLRSSETSIAKRLYDLYARKVLIHKTEDPENHSFTAATAELAAVIDDLAKENQARPYRVIEAIYSRPTKALLNFAEAFKLRGEKK